MPGVFLDDFFRSGTAKEQYGKASRLFTGATWIPSPLSDPSIREPVWGWWKGYYDKLIAELEDYAATDFKEKEKLGWRIHGTLQQIVNPTEFPPGAHVTQTDLVKKLTTDLERLKGDLTIVMRKQRDKEGLGPALKGLIDASFTVGMSAIAKLQHADAVGAGRQLSFNSVFNELFMRDRIAALYELVGDLPNRLWYGTEETPDNYALKATEALELFITIPGKAGKLDVPAQLRELMSSMEKTQKVLDQNPSDSTAGREREDTVLRLAILAQELGKETRRLTRGSRDFNPSEAKAADAIVLSAILAEGIRGALGKSRAEDVRGPAGAHRIPKRLERSDVSESLKFGRKRLVEVREKAKKEEKDPVDPRHYRGVEK